MKAITAAIIIVVAVWVGSDMASKAANVGVGMNARNAQALSIGE